MKPLEPSGIKFSRLSAVADLGSRLLKATTVDHLLSLILKQVLELMNADACVIWLGDTAGNMVPKISYGLDERTIEKFKTRFGNFLVRKSVEKDRPYPVYNLQSCKLPILGSVIKKERLESFVASPLKVEGQRMGALIIFSRTKRRFTPVDLKMLDVLSRQSALAITNIGLYQKMDKKLHKRSREMSMLFTVSRSIYSVVEPDLLLSLMLEKARLIVGAKFCTLKVGGKNFRGKCISSAVGISKKYARSIQKFEESCSLGAQKYEAAVIIKDGTDAGKRGRFPSVLRKKNIRSLVVIPLFSKKGRIGTISAYVPSGRDVEKDELGMLDMIGGFCSMAIDNAVLLDTIKKDYLNMIKTLAKIIDANDPYTKGHCDKVKKYSELIVKRMRLPKKTAKAVKNASLLHDIGKIGIDLSVIRKSTKLSEEDWDKIKMHPEIGADIVSRAGFLNDIVPIIRHHHARFGGGGYPDSSIVGEKIPLGARILSVADSFDAMTRDRPYRKAMSRDEAINELKRCSGTQFDPQIVDVFTKSF